MVKELGISSIAGVSPIMWDAFIMCIPILHLLQVHKHTFTYMHICTIQVKVTDWEHKLKLYLELKSTPTFFSLKINAFLCLENLKPKNMLH